MFTVPNIIICLVYIPPNVTDFYFNSLLMYLRSLHVYHKFIIMGNLNFPDIDWDTITGSNRVSSLFCNLTFDLNLSQVIHHPTHIKGNILDLVLTNDYTLISDVKVDCNRKLVLSSDYFPIYFSIISQNVKHVSPKQNLSYIFKKGNLNGLCDFVTLTSVTLQLT